MDEQRLQRQRNRAEELHALEQQRQAELEAGISRSLMGELPLLEERSYGYYHKDETPLTAGMDEDADIQREAPPATLRQESRWERKKRESAARKAEKQLDAVRERETSLLGLRTQAREGAADARQYRRAERALLEEKLKAAGLYEEASRREAISAGALDERTEREIRWRAQADRATAYGEYARMLPAGSKERAAAMEEKERVELRADELRRLYRVSCIENPAEREREERTVKKHAFYDVMKKLAPHGKSPLAREDATWRAPNGHLLVNVGRAYFGGTKPMYVFEDKQAPIVRNGQVVGYKQYLYKEAMNCIGWRKAEGALVTEAASKLQQILCGEYAIPAFAAVQDGEVLGSFQEKLDTMQGDAKVDLYSWQAAPQDNLAPEMKDEILREHTLDWLLCNFDTKGENFLHRTDGHLSSFDKEASFSFLKDEGAQTMSTTYKPHSNETLYNVIFREFAAGRIDLDLQKTGEVVRRVESMDRGTYLGMFEAMLKEKYGAPGSAARIRAEETIWQRKAELAESYRNFYTSLLEQRRAALAERGAPDDHAADLGPEGKFEFQAPAGA